MIKRSLLLLWILSCCLPLQQLSAQELPGETLDRISSFLLETARKEIAVHRVTITAHSFEGRTLTLEANRDCSYIPFRKENVKEIYDGIRKLLPAEYASYTLELVTNGKKIEDLIPLAFRNKRDKAAPTFRNQVDKPLVTPVGRLYTPTHGLQNRHIALWQSHGFYYEPKLTRWEWQRARIFQTVEDLYTQSYVLPFVVPMLENAGANVLLPRERDIQIHEVIIDNDGIRDGQSSYIEYPGDKPWNIGTLPGFAHLRPAYKDFENPFREGTYRQTETIKKGNESMAEWIPSIPETGSYAVYVSYQTLPNSTDDALYTIHHLGGVSQFKVNQQMGGGTWIYLRHFSFAAGKSHEGKVVLTNRSEKAGRILTADGVKIGGGYGNIARRISDEGATDNVKSSDNATRATLRQLPPVDYPYETSGYPRFTEGARYWLQWAGIPDSIYSESQGKNDYTDDYKSRGMWVNYLAGGSSANPTEKGLNIPIDLSLAFHTDAGTTPNDSIIGTLGIFHTEPYDGVYANGTSRYMARDLTDLIQSYIVDDIRTLYDPSWSRRGMWNQSYFEARVPRVPAMLLELLSHQNFADMRYGLDPHFRFTVSRSIYKGMLRFLSSQYNTEYVVQPLPVDHMNLCFLGGNEVELTWQPVDDPLEPTAKADKYIVYTRIGEGAFDKGTLVDKPSYRTSIPAGVVCGFKVTAVNKGGESFPSEILSAAKALNEKGTVLVINGFNRISAPADFDFQADSTAGFLDLVDHGVPYLNDISYIGRMKEFRRQIPWMDDDASGFGDSYANYETMVIAGNTFDYPSVHGSAILKAGYSFVSCSDEVLKDGTVSLKPYAVVDLILGKECQTKMGPGELLPLTYKTFDKEMQKAITDYCQSGGNIFVSGAYVGTDLWDNWLAESDPEDQAFATEVLKYKWRVNQAAVMGQVKSVASPFRTFTGNYAYYNELNPESYVVESPDAIEPAAEGAYTVFRYSENNLSAGVAYQGDYKTCVLGFPFESVKTPDGREQLMKAILLFFQDK
ncbi:MAG: xanthan lyase [Bacteroides sp.]|nr:xanthan lyase [Bacteroides sp.]